MQKIWVILGFRLELTFAPQLDLQKIANRFKTYGHKKEKRACR